MKFYFSCAIFIVNFICGSQEVNRFFIVKQNLADDAIPRSEEEEKASTKLIEACKWAITEYPADPAEDAKNWMWITNQLRFLNNPNYLDLLPRKEETDIKLPTKSE